MLALLIQFALCIQLLTALALCPAPFSLEAGKCVFVNPAQYYSWCAANLHCASIGGQLINSYSSLRLLGSMPSLNCGCMLWLGLSDLANERGSNRSGWQMIRDNGILPLNDSMWTDFSEPNGATIENCVMKFFAAGISNNPCSMRRGFACERISSAALQPPTSATWQQTPFKRTGFHASTEYCFTDQLQVANSLECMAAAVNSGSSRHMLYNSRLRACRLLQFTDAQVEEEIETSPDWVKYSVY